MAKKRLKKPYDKYSIDSNGNVWSSVGGKETKVKPREDKDGYLRVNLADGGTSKNGFKEIYIHKLVAKAFCGPGTGQVLHKDGNNQNNKASNLEYGSASKNAKQREKHKRDRADSIDDVELTDDVFADLPTLLRFDSQVQATWRITPEGYLQADRIIVAQSKEYEYVDETFPDGIRREFVTVDALQSLADTLVGKPITDEHPAKGSVDATTWRQLARGVVQAAWVEEPNEYNDLEHTSCIARAVVSDEELIAKILRDNIREVSPGYNATLSRVPDNSQITYGGAHFLQTSRAGNHLAVTRAGRGGSASAIRLDSEGHAITEDAMEKEELQKKLDAAEKAVADMQEKMDAQQAKIDAFEAAAKKNEQQSNEDAKDAEDMKDEKPERMDAADFVRLYNDRRKAEDAAKQLGVTVAQDMTTRAIKEAVIKAHLGDSFRRLDTAVEVDAAFEVVSSMVPRPNSPEHLSDVFRRADSTPRVGDKTNTVDLSFYDAK